MFVVNDDLSIYLNRGDMLFFNVSAKDHGYPYTFKPGDIVRISVTAKKDVTDVYIQKDFPVHEATRTVFIYLEGYETKIGDKISKYRDYWYEIVLNPDTLPQTIIGNNEDGPKIFRLFPEADDKEEQQILPEDIPVVDAELDMASDRPVSNSAVARAIAILTAAVEQLKGNMPNPGEEPDGSVFNALGQVDRLSILTIDAYGVAVRNGFRGTVKEWLDSLVGASGVYVGTDTPPDDAMVWVNPDGEPTSTEDWEFVMGDGSRDTKRVVVIGAEESNGYSGILMVRQEDGSWKEIPAIAGSNSGGNVSKSGLTEYHASNNLYDAANLVGTLTINGSSVSGLSNWIPVKAKTKYVSDKAMTQYYFFDSEKNYLSVASYMTAPVVFTAQQDGFLLINLRGATDVVVVEGTTLSNHYKGYYALKESVTKRVSKADNNTWAGKKWLAIGDSLTDPQYASEGYPYLVSKALGMTLTNLGASGKVMNYFVDLIPDFADDFDLVTVLLGTNNQGFNCAIGSLNDGADYKSNSSFYAQTQKIAEVLMAKYPSAVIAFLTPIRRTGVEGQNNNDEGYMVNALGLTTEPYAEAVKEVADYYGLPCLDLYHNGINPKSEWMRQLYFCNSDGTHPNNEGHAKYTAPVIKAFLESLAPFEERVVVEPDYPEPDDPGTDNPEPDNPVITYMVTNTLTNATNSNSAARVNKGASYSATIRAHSGYELGSVTVTMGGTNITTSAVSGGSITIASVTGNIVITAVATKTEVDSGEPVLVHSYIGTSIPESGVLEDQTGTFDLKGTGTFMANYSNQEGLAIEAGDSVSFKFVNVARNTLYYIYACWLNTSGLSHWNLGINGNTDSSGRFSVSPCGVPASGSNGTFGDADVTCGYRDDTGNEVNLKSGITWKKGETHTVTVTVNASDRTIKMYVDGEFTAESVMTCDLQVDGFTVCMNNDCPFERLEIYKGIVTDVG